MGHEESNQTAQEQFSKYAISTEILLAPLYEGCSNMNASSFLSFVANMHIYIQNGIRFYKGLYVIFKLALDLKKNTVFLLSYSPLNEGHFSTLTNIPVI